MGKNIKLTKDYTKPNGKVIKSGTEIFVSDEKAKELKEYCKELKKVKIPVSNHKIEE
jgi:hypothetical protein